MRAAVTLHAIIIPRNFRCGSYDRTYDHGLDRVCEKLSSFSSLTAALLHCVKKIDTFSGHAGRLGPAVPRGVLSHSRSGPAIAVCLNRVVSYHGLGRFSARTAALLHRRETIDTFSGHVGRLGPAVSRGVLSHCRSGPAIAVCRNRAVVTAHTSDRIHSAAPHLLGVVTWCRRLRPNSKASTGP